MFMQQKTVELIKKLEMLLNGERGDIFQKTRELKKENEKLERALDKKDFEIWKLKESQALQLEKAKETLRKEMQQSLIESDLKRTEAVAKLNTYIDMDTKDERKHIQKMLDKAIDALGKQKDIKITTK